MECQEAIDRYFDTSSTMRVDYKEGEPCIELFLYGALDLDSSRRLQNLLTWIVSNQPGHTCLIVNLAGVDYISSTGVGALSIALTEARKRDTSFKLRSLQPKVRSVFSLLGLMEYFQEADNDV